MACWPEILIRSPSQCKIFSRIGDQENTSLDVDVAIFFEVHYTRKSAVPSGSTHTVYIQNLYLVINMYISSLS